MRHYLPTPEKGLKNKLSKYFKIITVDKYKTSKICSSCDKELEKIQDHIKKDIKRYIVYCVIKTLIVINYGIAI